jgi:RNA ligase (TIGR02306 family)
MASFEVKVYKLKVLPHPKADRLELAQVGAYLSIIPKGMYKDGALGVYIPEQAIVPDDILEELNLTGRLGGKAKNRVKAMRLRGIVSQGVIYPNTGNWEEGELLNDTLGIIKYEPVIPASLAGEVSNVGLELTIKYDIDNIKKFNEVIKVGELVQITEKLHGTFSMFSAIPTSWIDEDSDLHEKLIDGRFIAASKGLGAKGLAFKDNDKNRENVYIKTAKELDLFKLVGELADKYNTIVTIAGEIFGGGIQDLGYSFSKPQFRLFDVAIGNERIEKRFLNHEDVENICKEFNIERVPLLYVGKFSQEVLDIYTNGKETVSGKETHIREGVVVKPLVERYEQGLGRVMLKSISDAYLLRKDGTEYT